MTNAIGSNPPTVSGSESVLITGMDGPGNSLAFQLRELWNYRELLFFLIWRDVKIRYKQTAIGVVWVVIQPLLSMGVFTLFFGRLAKLPSDGLPYPVFYFAALVPWTYFATALQSTTNVVVDNQRVITKVYFPRLILPLASVLSGLVDFGIGFTVLIFVTLGFKIAPNQGVLWLPAFTLLAVATALGVGLWLSALNALYRDVRYVMGFFVQFWMLASPVAYPSSLVPPRWRWLYGLNPMSGVIEGFRWGLTGHGQPTVPQLISSSLMVLAVLLGGVIFFQRMEGRIADVV